MEMVSRQASRWWSCFESVDAAPRERVSRPGYSFFPGSGHNIPCQAALDGKIGGMFGTLENMRTNLPSPEK
jgi:hypothetical protein